MSANGIRDQHEKLLSRAQALMDDPGMTDFTMRAATNLLALAAELRLSHLDKFPPPSETPGYYKYAPK